VFMVILMVMGVALSFKTNEHLWYLNRFNIGLMLFGSMGMALLLILLTALASYLNIKRTLLIYFSTPEGIRDYLNMEIHTEYLDSPMGYPQMKIVGSFNGLIFDIEYFQAGGAHVVHRLYLEIPNTLIVHKKALYYHRKYGRDGVSLAHFGLLRNLPYRKVKRSVHEWVSSSTNLMLKIAFDEGLIAENEPDEATNISPSA